MSTSSFVVSFRNARLFVKVDAATFATAKESLAPALSGGMDAETYTSACEAVKGQEFSFSGAVDAGLVDENGDACEGVELFQAE